MHGHSFQNLKKNPNSNYLIGNYTNKLNDRVVSFMVSARSNELYTGWIHEKNGK